MSNKKTDIDEIWMRRALRLARKGIGRTNPNPMVGCVIVKDDRVIGEGYHHKAGEPHAEIMALRSATESVKGSTVYVTLEPCSHYGRTPPCADALVSAGVSRVVAALKDPNPKVSGDGLARLKSAGIDVSCGILESEAFQLNEIFIKYITTGMPFTLLKCAMSLDGKIATRTGDSKWISGEKSRAQVHKIRTEYRAIMVGIGTVLNDNPHLTSRKSGYSRDPIRVIADGLAETPTDCLAILEESYSPCLIAVTKDAPQSRIDALQEAGAEVLVLPGSGHHLDLKALMSHLASREIDSVLIEGGGNLAAAALNAGIVDKVLFFYAPKIIGGKEAITPVEGEGVSFVQDAIHLDRITVRRFGEDVAIQGYVQR